MAPAFPDSACFHVLACNMIRPLRDERQSGQKPHNPRLGLARPSGGAYGVGRDPRRAKSLRRDRGDPRRRHRHRRRRVRRPGRTVGLRQVHPAAHDRGAREHHGGRDPHRRARGQRRAAEGARHRDGVPELRALSAHDSRRQHGFSLKLRGAPKARDRGARRARGRHSRARRAARPLSAPALGRPAPARRHGTRDRARPAGVPVRRAAVEPRCQAARRHAHRDQGTAPAPARPRRSTSRTTRSRR